MPFVGDIVSVAERERLSGGLGLYIGCGNGRNFLPLLDAGLDFLGLDVSRTGLGELAARVPSQSRRLIHGDISVLPDEPIFEMVVGIQVFQHGNRLFCHDHIRDAQRLVVPGGILAIRVNSVETDVEFAHEVVEPGDGSGFTIRYLAGPKSGLLIHFFALDELTGLFGSEFRPAFPVRLDSTIRDPSRGGQWGQWQGIWVRA